MRIDLVTIMVADYDAAIEFFVSSVGFIVAEDSPALTDSGKPKRWVVVRPPSGGTGVQLALAEGADQESRIGRQLADRVGFFLHTDDFSAKYQAMQAAGVHFLEEPRHEPYGDVAVFSDIAGNRWDLMGPPSGRSADITP